MSVSKTSGIVVLSPKQEHHKELFFNEKIKVSLEDDWIFVTENPDNPKMMKVSRLKAVVIATHETIETDKTTGRIIRFIHAKKISSDGSEQPISFDAATLTKKTFYSTYISTASGSVLQTEESKALMYNVFCASGEDGLQTEQIYTQQGLSADNKWYRYGNSLISTHDPDVLTRDNGLLRRCVEAFLSLCSDIGVAFLLLTIRIIGLLFEMPDRMRRSECRALKPTYITNVVGTTGTGKTTLAKAALDFDPDRYFAMTNSTPAKVFEGITETFSKVVIVDDTPPDERNQGNKDGVNLMKFLLRVYGDIGAEKKNAVTNPRRVGTWAVLFSEDLFLTVKSDILRTVPIFVKAGTVNFEAVSRLTDDTRSVDTMMEAFLRWFFKNISVDENGFFKAEKLLSYRNIAYSEIKAEYPQDTPFRLYDSHASLLGYGDLLCDFMRYIGIEEEFTAKLRSAARDTLKYSLTLQMTHIKESSLTFAVEGALLDTFDNGVIGSFNFNGSSLNLRMDKSPDECDGYRMGEIFLMFSDQKAKLYSRVREHVQGRKVLDKDIKNAIAESGLMYSLLTKSTVKTDKETRITSNVTKSRGQRVLVLRLPKYIIEGEKINEK